MTTDHAHPSNRILFLWIGSLIAISVSFFLIQFKIRPHGDFPVALHYNVLVGVDSFGAGWSLYIIPGAGLFITALNFFLHRSLRLHDRFLAFLAAFISLATSLILVIATLFLLNVN